MGRLAGFSADEVSGGCDGQDLSSTGREKAVIKSGGIQQLEHAPPFLVILGICPKER
jgi:hypothetical protein